MRRQPMVVAIGALLLGACAGGSTAVSSTTTSTIQSVTTTVAPTITTTTTEAPTTTTTFAPRFDAAGLFTFVSSSPVITNGPDLEWDWQYTDPGAAVYHDGSIHVFQNGFVGWPAPVGVGYWRSDDLGKTWIEVSEDPVFDGTDLDYVGRAALASSVLVLSDGTWVLYFYTWDAASWPAGQSKIGRATAPSPTGPWTADPLPVLFPGPEGSWDDFAVLAPSVIKTENGFEMFFTGRTRETAMIGRALSQDGISWTKYDDPATTDALYTRSDPVLPPGDPRAGNVWDQRNVMQPRVVKTDDGYVMVYTAANTITDPVLITQKYGLAVSPDGLQWRRSSGEVINPGTIDAAAFWFTELLYAEDTYFLFVEAMRGQETEVYLATHQGRIAADG
ncbi:MAG: hypothetical protein ACXWH0_00170 [Acidimicrobiia bacterium]